MIFYRPILGILFFIFCTIDASGQCIAKVNDPCVEINQSDVDRSAKAGIELLSARDAITKLTAERLATDAEKAALRTLNDALNGVIDAKGKVIASQEQIIAIQEKAIRLYAELVEKLQGQINRPKSAWKKFLQVVEKIIIFAAGAALRGGI